MCLNACAQLKSMKKHSISVITYVSLLQSVLNLGALFVLKVNYQYCTVHLMINWSLM